FARKKDIFSLGPPEEKLSVKYSHPLFLVERWIKEFGLRKTEEILKENQEIPKFDLLINIKKINLKEMKDLLLKNKIIAEETPYCPAGLKILKGNIKDLPEEIKKKIYVMDLTAQGFAHLFSQFKGNSFIDLASAPGGKSLCISLFHNFKIQIASDLFFTRLFKAKKNFQNFEREIKLLIQSILKPALKEGIFDRILLDAPCSGTGVLRKNPEAKWRIEEKDFLEYKNKQKELLKASLNLLSKGGLLLYITCSLEREENEEVVLETIEEKKGFEIFNEYKNIKHPVLNFLEPSGFIRVFPQEELDGMTGVIIKKL
ncbi:MAG: RsmB/NOP family class I SAM-dependent RNA methyltransferase, partial [Thermoanaerobaculia bacterium]